MRKSIKITWETRHKWFLQIKWKDIKKTECSQKFEFKLRNFYVWMHTTPPTNVSISIQFVSSLLRNSLENTQISLILEWNSWDGSCDFLCILLRNVFIFCKNCLKLRVSTYKTIENWKCNTFVMESVLLFVVHGTPYTFRVCHNVFAIKFNWDK